MKAVIDTCSLLALVRYYLPLDKKGALFHLFKKKIETGEIIIIDKVLEECKYLSQGIVLTTLDYLTDKTFLGTAKALVKTDDLLAPSHKKFLRQVENQFVNTEVRKGKKLTDEEFNIQKNKFLRGADLTQIILCLNLQKNEEKVVLVTEETESNNDNKLFKKIPAICKELAIETMTLPKLLVKYNGVDIDISFQ